MRAISKCRRKKLALPAIGFAEVSYQHRLRITDGRIHDQRLPGEERQAFDVARLHHGEREGVSARSDEDRDPAFEDLARAAGSIRRKCARRSRSRIFTARRPRIGGSRVASSFRRPVSRFRNSGTTASTIALLDEKEGTAIRNGRSRRTNDGRRRPRGVGSAARSLCRRDLLDAVLRRGLRG